MKLKLIVITMLLIFSSCNNQEKKILKMESENKILSDSLNAIIQKGVEEMEIIISFRKSAYLFDEKIDGQVNLCGLPSFPSYSVFLINEKTKKERLLLEDQNSSGFSFQEEVDNKNIQTNMVNSKEFYTYGLNVRIEFEGNKYSSVTSPTYTADLLPFSKIEWNQKLDNKSKN